jgi:hypothetical protein
LVFADIKSSIGVTLLSHSAASHPAVAYLVSTCGFIKSQVLMDPVDGYDPYGVIKEFITNPPKQLSFLMPTLIITTGLDSIQRGPGFPACAPANFSNLRFYASLSGPTWLLNFTSYGHADVLDDFVSPSNTRLC